MNNSYVTLAFAAVATTIAGAALATTGIVVNYEGKPVPKAKVYAFLGDTINSKKALIYTNTKGKFVFNPAKPGRYYYVADAEGYGYAMACDKKGSPGSITLKVWPKSSVSGQVIDPKGTPVANATVSIHAFDAWDNAQDEAKGRKPWIWFRDKPAFFGSVKTDTRGRFTIGRIPDPTMFSTIKLRLDVNAPGRATSYRYFNQNEVASKLTIVSSRACTLTGTVHIPADSGIAPQTIGVMVRYSLPGSEHSYRTHYLDENGKFAFYDLPQGPLLTISLGNTAIQYDDQTGQPIVSGDLGLVVSELPMPVLVAGEPQHIEIELTQRPTELLPAVETSPDTPAAAPSAEIDPQVNKATHLPYAAAVNPEMVPELIKQGEDVNAMDADGVTALHWAVLNNHYGTAKILLENGANVNVKEHSTAGGFCGWGWYPLHLALRNENKDMVNLLIKHGADVNAKRTDGWTPLFTAAYHGQPDVIRLLIHRGANVKEWDSEPFRLAIREQKMEAAQIFLNAGADINGADISSGRTAVHNAVRRGYTSEVAFLINHKAKIDTKDNEGRTPLFDAANSGFADIVRLLVANGAKVDTRAKDGMSVLQSIKAGKTAYLASTEKEYPNVKRDWYAVSRILLRYAAK